MIRIGVDIGGSHVGVGVIKNGNLIDMSGIDLSKQDKQNIKEALVNHILELINEVLDDTQLSISEIDMIGIAAPGTIKDNIIVKSPNLGLFKFDIISELQKTINLPMQIRNDSKCAAIAEKYYGSLKDADDCVFLCMGTGIGAAVFMGGKLLEPKRYAGFEIGHMVIVKDGLQCNCGKRGCFETYASMRALKRNIAEVLEIDNDFTGRYLNEKLLDFNNEKIEKVIDEYLDYLKVGLCNIIDIFEPEVISLGGSFAYYEDNPIFKKLLDKLKEPNSTYNQESSPEIKVAKFKNDAGIIGATVTLEEEKKKE